MSGDQDQDHRRGVDDAYKISSDACFDMTLVMVLAMIFVMAIVFLIFAGEWCG
jgi:hypothetical protein